MEYSVLQIPRTVRGRLKQVDEVALISGKNQSPDNVVT